MSNSRSESDHSTADISSAGASDDLMDAAVDAADDDESSETRRRRDLELRMKRRHYKKDSRFLLDLYTITFDEDQVSI
jgi:hypothetical protein